MTDFQPMIDAGRELARKLEHIGNKDQYSLSPEQRVTISELTQWYDDCTSVIEGAFGKGAHQVQDFNQALKRLDDIQHAHPRVDGTVMEQEVERIRSALALLVQFQALVQAKEEKIPTTAIPRNPWISGSFYLAVMVVVVVLLLVAARTVPPMLLPAVIIGAILAVTTVGAFQLRNDAKLKEKSFLSLMRLIFGNLPLLHGRRNKRKPDRTAA